MSIAFPGYVSDVHAADALDPAWGNAVRDRAIQVFDTSTNRDAAITVPQTGQVGVLTTLTTAGIYVRHGATVGWVAPWNLGWGEVARTALATSQSNADATEHVVTGLATTFTALANRKYRITLFGVWQNLDSAAHALTLKIKDGTSLIGNAIAPNFPVTTGQLPVTYSVETSLTAGSHTINVTHQSPNAAGLSCAATASPAYVVVDDIGPSGAPS